MASIGHCSQHGSRYILSSIGHCSQHGGRYILASIVHCSQHGGRYCNRPTLYLAIFIICQDAPRAAGKEIRLSQEKSVGSADFKLKRDGNETQDVDFNLHTQFNYY